MTDETYQKGIETAIFMGILALLVLVGSSARAMARWQADGRSISRVLGSVVASTASAIAVGLILLDVMPDRPLLVLGLGAAIGQLGTEFLDDVIRRILRRYGLLAPEKEVAS